MSLYTQLPLFNRKISCRHGLLPVYKLRVPLVSLQRESLQLVRHFSRLQSKTRQLRDQTRELRPKLEALAVPGPSLEDPSKPSIARSFLRTEACTALFSGNLGLSTPCLEAILHQHRVEFIHCNGFTSPSNHFWTSASE